MRQKLILSSYIKLADFLFQLESKDDFFNLFFEKSEKEIVSHIFAKESTIKPSAFCVESISTLKDIVLRDVEYGDIICCDKKFENVDYYPAINSNPNRSMLLVAIYSRLCFENVLLCHSSLIDYNGHGILFVGPSGIGKTTQAELWQKYRNATIINGDKAFLKMKNDELIGYGLPWKGSCGYCLNSNVKIDAVVALRQDNNNHIKKLSAEDVFKYFVPHIFLPHWDENCMKSALETLDNIVNSVPVYLLKCRPDEEAVMLTEATVLG